MHALASLQGPLLVGYALDPESSRGIAHRLDRLVPHLRTHAEPTATDTGAGAAARADLKHGSSAPGVACASIEGPLAKLEQAIVRTCENVGEGDADYAPA